MRRFTGIPLVLLAAASLSAQQTATTPQQPQTFRSGVQLIEVDVRVFGKDGRFVADLAKDDFEVLENGVPQRIDAMYLVVGSPAAAANAATKPVDPATPAPPTAPARGPAAAQTWIFMFDLNHLTPGGGFDRARKAVGDFIAQRFKEGDLAGVVAGEKMVNNRLTSVRHELVDAVKQVKPRSDARNRFVELTREWPRFLDEEEAIRAARDDRDVVARVVSRACAEQPDMCAPPVGEDMVEVQVRSKAVKQQQEIHRATNQTLAALNALASGLAKMAGPKTVVFLSDGFVVQDVETTLRTVVGQTARAGGRVYAIDVRGLNRTANPGIIDQMLTEDPNNAVTKFDTVADGTNSLAVDTGGMMIRNENNIGRALDRIVDDAGRYYVLAYQPANTEFDGKFRPIQVRVKRPGVRVRARRGYLALEPSKMLIPRPITSEGPAADLPADLSAGARSAEVEAPSAKAEPPAETAIGTVVTAPPPASSMATTRLRPNVDETLKSLAGADTAAAAGDHAKKGWDAYQRGDVENALVSFTAAAEQPDVRPWVLYALGLSQVALARPLDAVASWERVRTAVPEFEPVYIDLADTYVQLSDLTKALAVLRDAEKRWPKDTEIHNAIGVIHFRRGALDDAIDAFARATAVQPEDALGYYNLGRAYEMRFARGQRYVSSQRKWVAPSQDDRRKAEESYEQCVKLGGPYAQDAADAISRLQWSKK